VRTTIELSDEHRARLLALAAERGEKGFSTIIAEAVEHYLRQEATREVARDRALSLRGGLSRRDTDSLRTAVAAWREHWR
jgi:predicted transcriptional regulator